MSCFANQQSRTQRYWAYNNVKKSKVANSHLEAGTINSLAFLHKQWCSALLKTNQSIRQSSTKHSKFFRAEFEFTVDLGKKWQTTKGQFSSCSWAFTHVMQSFSADGVLRASSRVQKQLFQFYCSQCICSLIKFHTSRPPGGTQWRFSILSPPLGPPGGDQLPVEWDRGQWKLQWRQRDRKLQVRQRKMGVGWGQKYREKTAEESRGELGR